MKNYIFYSTILCAFTEALSLNIGFDLKFFYFVVFINFIILVSFNKVIYTKGLLIFHCLVLFSGLFSCVFGYNKFGYFFIQFFFLLLIPTYYNSFFNFFKDRFTDIASLYCKICFILAVIGFLKLPHDISIGRSFESLLLEPAHYCTIVLPAYFITLKDKNYPRYYFIIIMFSIIVSGSSLGFLGLGLSLILMLKKISLTRVILPIIGVTFIGTFVYFNFAPFKLRVDDTVNSMVSGDLSKANLSTYALLSNFYVSAKSFSSNPIIGNGIGSHVYSRELYLSKIEGIEVFESINSEDLNAKDAGSLFSRVMSELGLMGLLGIFIYISKFYVKNLDEKSSINSIICKGIMLYFFAKLFREGHYFSPEMYFFVFLYVFNKYDSSKSNNLQLTIKV